MTNSLSIRSLTDAEIGDVSGGENGCRRNGVLYPVGTVLNFDGGSWRCTDPIDAGDPSVVDFYWQLI